MSKGSAQFANSIVMEKPASQQEPDDYLDCLIKERTVVINQAVSKDAHEILKEQSSNKDNQDWGRILGAAPEALASLGLCFIAANSAEANIEQTTKSHLPNDLRTNITDIYDKGLDVFKEAEAKMDAVSRNIRRILQPLGIMDEIVESIEDAGIIAQSEDRDTKELMAELATLQEHLKTLSELAQKCTTDSKEIVDKFDRLATLARDINSAFTAAQADLDSKSKKPKSLFKEFKQFFGIGKKEKSTTEDREELTKMFTNGATKQDVIMVLQFCLNHLLDIKKNLNELLIFFQKLNTNIQEIDETEIPALVKLATTKNLSNVKKTKNIHARVLQIRVQYILAGAKSAMYATVSDRYIMPGVTLVSSLAQITGDSVGEQIGELIKYSEKAREDIRVLTEGKNTTQLEVREATIKQVRAEIEGQG